MVKAEKTRRAGTRQSQQHDGRKATASGAVKRKYTAKQARSAFRDAAAAMRCIEANPDGWREVVATYTAAAEAGRHITADQMTSIMSKKRVSHIKADHGRDTTFNHSLEAFFIRYLIAEYPEVRNVVELRGSRFDILFHPDSVEIEGADDE